MLTSAQLSTLQAAIAADTTLAALGTANGFQQIADAMNLASSPAVAVWIPNLPTSSVLSAILAADMPITAGLIGYLQMLLMVGTIDATQANVRTNFATVFTGKTTLTNLTAAAQRTATRFEALSAFLSVASPANVSNVFGHTVTAHEVAQALGKDA